MKAKIISIGNELLKGDTVNTNTSFLSKGLANIGIETIHQVTCSDNIEAIVSAVNEDSGTAEIIIICGGLGPTDDDLTREALAKAFNSPLIIDEGALKDIKGYFEKRSRVFHELNISQAKIPKGAKIIKNDWGTAPGLNLERDGIIYYVLPGVPTELMNMFKESVVKDLEKRFGNLPKTKVITLKMFGIAESRLNELINRLEKPKCVELGYYPKMPEVHLQISFPEKDIKTALEYKSSIYAELARFIFAEDDEKLEEKIVDALIKNKLTLSLAESCTGGLVASTIVNVAGSSKCFERGVVTYSNESKIELLNVKRETMEKFGAVSPECAIEMAIRIRELAKTDLSISITGIAGPGGSTGEKPLGTAFICWSSKRGERIESFVFHRDRNMNRKLAMYEALTRLLKYLKEEKI